MHYTLTIWLLIFFTYCFMGWVWESSYVSLKKKEWVNRGFLHGPMLPIYGFGAIIILCLTLPVKDNLWLVYILGMLGATALEYVTGAVMEKMFNVRYWDYSDQPLNVNGHICLFVSLAWGFFSILLVKYIHPPVESFLLDIPSYIAEPVSLVILVCMVVDTTKSVQHGLDLKELLSKLAENNESFAVLEKKLSATAANISHSSEEFQKHLQRIDADRQESVSTFQEKMETRKKSRQAFLLERLQARRDRESRLFALLNEKVDASILEVQRQMQSPLAESEQAKLSKSLTELNEFKDELKQAELDRAARKDKEYKIAASLIQRNPTSVSRRFKESFGEIKSLNAPRLKPRKGKDKDIDKDAK